MYGRTIKRDLVSRLSKSSLHEIADYRATFAENEAHDAVQLCDAIGRYIYGKEYEPWIPKTSLVQHS